MDDFPGQAVIEESARTSSRRSGRSARVEIITRGERRRAWTVAEKQDIVAESLGPGLTPTEVARKYAISSGQLYTWRRQLLRVSVDAARPVAPRFAEVAVESAPRLPAPADAGAGESRACDPATSTRAAGWIEIMLPGGVVVRTDAQVDGRALRRVLGALQGR